ncbi:hypothetical protein H6P81_004041 [Aristolochia fimbriata]|uniref:Bet v I/Major latex protein domain-containing protein n=1 Tax=Aristolochia fimbriata TaxID=158543 RepID=A0AAV7E1L1_ARIFI|nr:hypothetical protein H6P81_017576 [Aristolochia fimbriata]KAG9459533.1 hypothetical protein H6P81_004041 [Aristolochia fimbriata]
MVAGSYSKACVSAHSPASLWKASADTHNLVPKLLPQQVSHVELLEGKGGSVGAVLKFNFGQDLKHLNYVKNRVEAVDEANRVIKLRVLEGKDMGTVLKSCVYELKMDETSEGGTKTTVKMDYDTVGDTPLPKELAESMLDGVLGQTKAIDAHLHANRLLTANA